MTKNYFFLGVFFLMSFNVFHLFPGFGVIKDVWIVFVFIYLCIVIICKQLLDRRRYSPFEWYIFALCLMPIYSATMSYLEFGQPLYYGIFAQRNILLISSSLMLIYWFKTGVISVERLEKVLCILSWFCLVLYISLIGLLDPAKYLGARGFVIGGVVEPVHFHFKSDLIVYAIFYYMLRGLKNNSVLSFVALLPFLYFMIIFDGGRSSLLALFFVIFAIILLKVSFFKLIIWSPLTIVVIGSLIFSFYYFNSDYIDHFLIKMGDAISVVISSEKSGDASANARIDETKMAWPYIEKNMMFGNGALSNQWENGFFGKLGNFAPSDIGLIGVVFLYGIFGVLIFLYQFVFARKFISLIPKNNRTILVEASISFLVFYFIHSLTTGKFIFHSYVSLLFISIIFISYKQYNLNKN